MTSGSIGLEFEYDDTRRSESVNEALDLGDPGLQSRLGASLAGVVAVLLSSDSEDVGEVVS